MTTVGVSVQTLDPDNAGKLAAFAAQRPLEYNDFASIAALLPDEPKVWIAVDDAGVVVGAAIDDGLAMSIAGDEESLRALATTVPDVADKLVIAGRATEVQAFVQGFEGGSQRRERFEHFMAVDRASVLAPSGVVPLRIAEPRDLPLLTDVRARALEEEYEMQVDRAGTLFSELERAVTRAVAMQGVAIWVENGKAAFTAQLIAKTPEASMFGDLYTDPELRGEGRATRALAAFCAWLMSESEHVTLRVGEENTPAVKLYERTGFTVRARFLSSLRADQP